MSIYGHLVWSQRFHFVPQKFKLWPALTRLVQSCFFAECKNLETWNSNWLNSSFSRGDERSIYTFFQTDRFTAGCVRSDPQSYSITDEHDWQHYIDRLNILGICYIIRCGKLTTQFWKKFKQASHPLSIMSCKMACLCRMWRSKYIVKPCLQRELLCLNACNWYLTHSLPKI